MSQQSVEIVVLLILLLIQFGKTMQIVITLVAATFKALLSVAQTNGRLSGCDFYAGNIYHLLENISTHTFTLSAYKKVRPKRNAPKKCFPPQLLSHELLPNNGMRKERKHFLPKHFPVLGIKIFNSCDEYILSHFCRFVNKA